MCVLHQVKKNLLNVFNISDLTADPERFRKQTRLNVISTDPSPRNTAINICFRRCRFKRGKV